MPRTSFVVRIALLLLLLAASLPLSPVSAQGGALVRVDPAAQTLQANATGVFAIKVDNVSNLTAIELHLTFNPAVLEVTGLTNGGFVIADFSAQNVYDNTAGTIDYAVAQMNRAPATGSGTLLTIAIRAKAAGSSTINVRATAAAPAGYLLSDQNGAAIQATWSAGTVTVGAQPGASATATATATATSGSVPPPASATPTATATATATSTTPTTTPLPGGVLGTHVVRLGEWVNCIARAYKVTPASIISTNNIKWPNLIFPNQKLVIAYVPWTNMTNGPVCQRQFTNTVPTPAPTASGTPPTATATATATKNPATATPTPLSACRATYVVKSGDTLFRIGLNYGVSYTELARVNHITDARVIYPGQVICIP